MHKIFLRPLCFFSFILLGGSLATEPLLDARAPDFQGRDIHGTQHRLRDRASVATPEPRGRQ
ncbi:MAG TPA: hypothetical protein ENI97_00240 [Gammaproteobacteria bacterium]|nr:hypothetical protein [Gammaproteobacteria bacterium]